MAAPAPDELTGLAGTVADVMSALGEVGVAVLVALENLFPPIPSEVVLPLAGFLASRGEMDLVLAIVAATVGSVVGALVLYEIGRRVGRARMRVLVHRLPLVQVEDLDRAEAWFARHGQSAVFFGRFIPVVRSLISVPAGVECMPRVRFLVLTAIGSAIWNTVFVVSGYLLGEQFDQVGEYSKWFNYAVYAVIIALVVLGVRRAVRERRERARQSG